MIYLVSGKGGVGKSLVSASLAKSLSDQGRKVLVVELGGRSFFSLLYGLNIGFEPRSTPHGFSVALWDGPTCLREYFLHLLKIQRMVDLFFDNRITQTLVEGAPGLKELALTGKITSGVRKIGPSLPFDDVIVDAYSSGHFKALISAPLAMSEAIKIGPMGEQSRAIDRILKSNQTKYIVVLNPEELSITEGLELKEHIQSEFSQNALLVGNKWWPNFDELELSKSTLPTAFLEKCKHIKNLQLPVDVVLPQLWEEDNLQKISSLGLCWRQFGA